MLAYIKPSVVWSVFVDILKITQPEVFFPQITQREKKKAKISCNKH